MEYTESERAEILAKMQHTSNTFYLMAVQTQCHPFIEFCGLMNEYIKICEAAHTQGLDFTQANTHTGNALPMQDYQVKYLAEKIACIYGPTLHSDSTLAKAFLDELGFGGILPSQDEGLDGRNGSGAADDHP